MLHLGNMSLKGLLHISHIGITVSKQHLHVYAAGPKSRHELTDSSIEASHLMAASTPAQTFRAVRHSQLNHSLCFKAGSLHSTAWYCDVAGQAANGWHDAI